MGAFSIANIFKPKGHAPSIAKASRGRLFERAALAHCRRSGYRVRETNLRLGRGEIDILAESRDGRRLIIVEVRGRSGREFRPSWTLTPAKRARLERMAGMLARRERRGVAIELVQVTGRLPNQRWRLWLWGLIVGAWPEALGLRLQVFRLDPCD